MFGNICIICIRFTFKVLACLLACFFLLLLLFSLYLHPKPNNLVYFLRITSPMLLFAVAASLGACYILSLKNAEKKIVIGGHEIPLAHQYGAVGILSLPVFYLAGAGAVLFWVLGLFRFCYLCLSFQLLYY